MKIPNPVFIGYFPKKTMEKDNWFGAFPVQEICSVSNCMSDAPENWIDQWKHNAWSLYDTEDLAWSIIEDDLAQYDMYAYRVLPTVFDGATAQPVSVDTTATPHLDDFDFLGYDPVSHEAHSTQFGHSPLSCNRGFEKYPVNRFCLLDDLNESWRITAEIAQAATEKGLWEPGPYYLCEVHRKKKANNSVKSTR